MKLAPVPIQVPDGTLALRLFYLWVTASHRRSSASAATCFSVRLAGSSFDNFWILWMVHSFGIAFTVSQRKNLLSCLLWDTTSEGKSNYLVWFVSSSFVCPELSRFFLRSRLNGEKTALTSSVKGIVEGMSSEVWISLACFHWPSCEI